MITLRDLYAEGFPSVEDVGFLYRLLLERRPIESISHSTMPTVRQHTEFVNSKPYAMWFIVYEFAQRVGTVNLTNRNEIGIAVVGDRRHQGIGSKALRLFIETHRPLRAEPSVRPGHFLANINPENVASRRLFEEAGFRLKQVTYQLP